jgi:hypothetical protein
MLSKRQTFSPRANDGAAILIFVTIILLAATTLLVSEISVNKGTAQRAFDNASVLGQANQSLLGYALMQGVPGTLPCPDTTGDGLQNQTVAGCQSQLGLLPTRTLNLPALTDSSGARLWYAASLNLVANSAAVKNSSSPANLQLDGQPVVALVIAPGSAVNGQSRRQLVMTDYLEGINANADLSAYESLTSANNNDQLVSLEPDAYWSLIERRVVTEATSLLNRYKTVCGEFPWAANFGGPYNSVMNQQSGSPPLNTALPNNWGAACAGGTAPLPAAWLVNHWQSQLFYVMCRSVEGACLNLIGAVPANAASIIIAPGIALSTQARPDTDVADYFEAENVSLPATQYRKLTPINHSSSYNDLSASLQP